MKRRHQEDNLTLKIQSFTHLKIQPPFSPQALEKGEKKSGVPWSQELDSLILRGPFQLRVFYDLALVKCLSTVGWQCWCSETNLCNGEGQGPCPL